MTINGREYSEPEISAYIKQLETACKQYEDENRQLIEKLDDIGEQYNAQATVIGFLEYDNKRLDDENEELKRLLCKAVTTFNDEALKLIGEDVNGI